LDCGTLLGAIRQNDFISKDTDVDIAAFEDDYAKSLEIVNDLNLLNEHNMICKRKKGKGVHEKIISLQIIGSNTYIDIYFWKWKPKLDKIEFKSKKYNAPYNSEMYLEYLYGPEWRIPCSDGCHANSYKHKEGIKNSTYFKQNKLISNF
jgi:phosphorylcholine metabolism protein LicD